MQRGCPAEEFGPGLEMEAGAASAEVGGQCVETVTSAICVSDVDSGRELHGYSDGLAGTVVFLLGRLQLAGGRQDGWLFRCQPQFKGEGQRMFLRGLTSKARTAPSACWGGSNVTMSCAASVPVWSERGRICTLPWSARLPTAVLNTTWASCGERVGTSPWTVTQAPPDPMLERVPFQVVDPMMIAAGKVVGTRAVRRRSCCGLLPLAAGAGVGATLVVSG